MFKCDEYYNAPSTGNLDSSSYTHQVENVDSSCEGQGVTYGLFHPDVDLHHSGSKHEKLLPLQQLGSDENVATVSGSTAFNFISPTVEYHMLPSFLWESNAGHTVVPTMAGNEGTRGSQSFSFIERDASRGSQSFSFIEPDAEEEVNGVSMCLQQTLPQEVTPIKESANTKESTNGQFETGSGDLINSEQLGTNVVLTHPPNNIVVDFPSLADIEPSLFNNQCGKTEDEEGGGDRDTDVEGILLATINTTDLIADDNGQVGCPPSSTVSGVLPPILSTETPEGGRCHNGKKLESPRGKKKRRRGSREKPHMWEIANPFLDKKREKKRIDAIRAKRNRDRNKKEIEELKRELARAIEIRNTLKTEVSQLREKEKSLTVCQTPPSLTTPNVSTK